MRLIFTIIFTFFVFLFVNTNNLLAQRQMENLDRGLVAVKTTNGVFLSWRLQGYEWYGYTYNLYRDGVKINSEPLEITNYVDNNGTISSSYHVETLFKGVSQSTSDQVTPWEQQYLEIPLKARSNAYQINDITAADLDGDGQYELIVKRIAVGWNDNNTNYSYFEAYKLDGTMLWEINVGPNILPDVEINIAAFDFDGDGKAEVFMRTSEGTIFGDGTMIGDTNGDGITNYRYSVGTAANMQYMNEGPEFLSLIDGETGAELDRVDFIPRGKSEDWGDGYGHRASKYFFGAPYLDGVNPSIFIGRGIYTKTEMRTYDVVDKKLVLRWSWGSGNSGPYFGQGNHNFTVADVDGDGRDEIIWGSMAVDDDGTGLYSTALGHGDAMHIGDLDPYRKGMEAWRCLENSPHWGTVYHDAGTGEILIHTRTGFDTGRAVAANISNGMDGKAMWGGGSMFGATSKNLIPGHGGPENFRIYWDGDLLEELLDHSGFTTSKGYGTGAIYKYGVNGPILLATGATSCNYTKGTPSLQADLLGDWREEVVWRTEDNSGIRIYTTIDPTEHRVYSLMHDHQYRQAIAWQMCGYNQPPHVSFFLGEREGKTVPPPPAISNGRLVYSGGDWVNGAQVWKKDGVTTAFADGDHILFDVSAGNDINVDLNYEVSPQVISVNSPEDIALNATNGKLTGEMLLIKSGAGNFELKGNHDYSGDTEVWAGRLSVDGNLTNSNIMLEFFGELDLKGKLSKNLKMRYGSELYVGGATGYGVAEIDGMFEVEKEASIYFNIENDNKSVLKLNGDFNIGNKVDFIFNIDGEINSGDFEVLELNSSDVFPLEKVNVKGLTGVPHKIKQVGKKLILEIIQVRPSSTIYWDGTSTNSTWDLVINETFKTSDSQTTYFTTNDDVIMDNSASNKIVSIEGEVVPNSIHINSSEEYKFVGDGSITGNTSLTKSGTGKLIIENINSFDGKVEIKGGVIEVDNMPDNINGNGGLGVPSSDASKLVLDGGTLHVKSGGNVDRAVTIGTSGGTIQNDGILYWNQPITGGTLTKSGRGRLILGGLNRHNKLIIKSGIVELLNEESNPGKTVVFDGGSLQSYDNSYTYSTWNWNFEVSENKVGTIYMDGRGYYTGTLKGDGVLDVVIPFVRTDFKGNWSSFNGILKVMGPGHANDDSSYDFRIDNDFGYPNAIVNLSKHIYAYHLSSRTVKFGALTGNGNLSGNHQWELGEKNTSFIFNGKITAGSVRKVGTGTFTITNANTYSGGTTISEGRITASNKEGSATGTGTVTIGNGGSLNGAGTIGGDVIIQSGGRLLAGSSTVGTTITLNKNLTIQRGGDVMIRINPARNLVDCLPIGNRLSIAGDLIINRSGDQFEEGQEFKIFDARLITGQFANITPEVPKSGLAWDTSKLYSDGIIKIVDNPTSINNSITSEISLYYNPIDESATIEMGDFVKYGENIKIKVVEIGGAVVKTLNTEHQNHVVVDLKGLSNGVYLISIESKEFVYTRRILKN